MRLSLAWGVRVSIPFIAGQWSLLVVVRIAAQPRNEFVSIPFIAGQWSLLADVYQDEMLRRNVSIPFIAGQWSLPAAGGRGFGDKNARFNPLHCGAVVASAGGRGASGSPPRVSIPFIAGQWSLRIGGGGGPPGQRGRFNPLHCGAVVASMGPRRRRLTGTGFNPLHCGAVVASPGAGKEDHMVEVMFQSPSLRGSGRFPPLPYGRGGRGLRFNPLHCGAVVASRGSWK